MRLIEHKVDTSGEESVVLNYVELTKDFEDVKNYVIGKGRLLTAYGKEKEMCKIRLDDVLYFEAVGELMFAYTEKQVYEIKMRLYQVERELKPYNILRASKSLIVNIGHIRSVRPALNGRLYARMTNGEDVLISRQYAKDIKSTILAG